MLSVQEYRKDPCGLLSIPHWKTKTFSLPDNMKIVHDREFDASYLLEYEDREYFRLSHPLQNIKRTPLKDFRIETAKPSDIPIFVEVINKSYKDLQVSLEQMLGYTEIPVYREDLWILVIENETHEVAGCGIGEYDPKAKEGILDWIQVLPEYRGRKIGQAMVGELLFRMKNSADFATVSGKTQDPTSPEGLYRKCGFIGDDVWHILRKK